VAELAVATIERPELEEAFHSLFLERRALYYRMLLRGEGPTDAYAESLVGAVLDGARVRPRPE
jgi:hypothetical protein